MLFHYDALIVGAGPAGCAAAYDLARAGRRVLLLDRRTFPRHKACACGLTRKTLKALRYSVEPILERQCRDVVLQEAGPAFLEGRRSADKACEVRVHLRQPFCAMAVRSRFDHYCLEQTMAAGRDGGHAELLHITTLVALREMPSCIELEAVLPDGTHCTFTAPALVGADGSNGQTRRLSNFSEEGRVVEGGFLREAHAAQLAPEPGWYARGFALEATVPYELLPGVLPAGDQPHDLVFDFAPIAGGYGWLFPKGDHINIGVGGFVPQAAHLAPAPGDMVYESVTRGLLHDYMRDKLGLDPGNLSAHAHIHVSGQHLGLGGDSYVPRGRVLLTGDAAGLVDPLTGEGIHSAITSGQAAAAALLEVLSPGEADPAPEKSGRLATAYARHLRPLQETLAFSHRAARSFYREPERGFRVMRTPLLRNLVLKTYADGLPTTKLLASLARRVA